MPNIDLVTVIFALVALFVAYKLRSVLGVRNDGQGPTGGLSGAAAARAGPGDARRSASVDAAATATAALPPAADRWQGVAEPEAWSGLDAIAAADRSFSAPAFLSGARAAYDMIVHAFAAGDAATLHGLMAPDAFANFDASIRSRAAAEPNNDDHRGVDRRRQDRGGAADRPNRAGQRALRQQARLRRPRCGGRRRRRLADGGRRPSRLVDFRSRRSAHATQTGG